MGKCILCEKWIESDQDIFCVLCERIYSYYLTYLEEEWAQEFTPNLYRILYDFRITDTFGLERFIKILLQLQRLKYLTIEYKGSKVFRIVRYRKGYPLDLATTIERVVHICESCGIVLYNHESFAFCLVCRYQFNLMERRKN